MNRPSVASAAAVFLLAGCGSAAAASPAAPAAAPADPTLTLTDTATLADGDTTLAITATLTCTAGHTAFGSAAVTDNTNAGDLSQQQGYTGLLRIPCTGQPQELPLTLTSQRTPFRIGPALARAAFTLDLCDPACRWVSTSKTITLVRPAGAASAPPHAPTPARTAPGEGGNR